MAVNVPKMALNRMIQARSLSSTASNPFAAHGGENAEKLRVKWKRITFLGFGIMGVCMVYNYLVHKEHEKHWKQPEFVPYSYMYIRKKKFPWGDGNHSLFHNKRTNALPEGYET